MLFCSYFTSFFMTSQTFTFDFTLASSQAQVISKVKHKSIKFYSKANKSLVYSLYFSVGRHKINVQILRWNLKRNKTIIMWLLFGVMAHHKTDPCIVLWEVSIEIRVLAYIPKYKKFVSFCKIFTKTPPLIEQSCVRVN